MKRRIQLLILAATFSGYPLTGWADTVFKCPDATGKIVFTDVPCATSGSPDTEPTEVQIKVLDAEIAKTKRMIMDTRMLYERQRAGADEETLPAIRRDYRNRNLTLSNQLHDLKSKRSDLVSVVMHSLQQGS